MRDNKYNTWQICIKCAETFFKTIATGNQCNPCRKEKKRKYSVRHYRKKTAKINDSESNVIIKFIDKIERHDGNLYSLSDLSDLLEYWNQITNQQSKYDILPAGHQLHHMWKDLLKYKYEHTFKIEKSEF